MVDIQGAKFPGYGRCIYCGSTGPLKDEHVIPFSLGGKAIIEAASCGNCEKVTSYLDGYLARQIFHEYRAHAGMKSRRPKERPSELAATIVKPDGTHEVRTFAPKEHPYFLIMPIWNLPGILLNEEPTNNFEIMQAHAYWWIPESMQNTAEMEREQVRATGTINYTAFARGIARISYCQAVAHLGLAGFDAMDLPGSFCGNTRIPPIMSASRGKTRHRQNRRARIDIEPVRINDEDHWMVSLRFFAHSGYENHGMPIYKTIVGKRTS
jgi:HNH endonuclease